MKKALFIAFAGILAAVGCKPEDLTPDPVASFNITSNDTLNIDQEFSFTNTSENATSYHWDFADGTSATTTNAVKVYTFDNTALTSEYNTFIIRLTATSDDGESSVATKNIVVTRFL